MEAAEIANMLRDLRSVKMSEARRQFVDRTRGHFEATGALSLESLVQLRQVCRFYGRQLADLHAARERARITNGLRRIGMTRDEAAAIRAERLSVERAHRADLGI